MQRNIGKQGAWGAAPDIDHADVHTISKTNTWLLFDEVSSGTGETGKYKGIISHKDGQWRFLGSILTSEDNYGSCSDDPEERRDLGYHSCQELNTVSMNYIPGKNPEYPEIVVTYTKTKNHQNNSNIAASPVKYLFNGVTYEPMTRSWDLFLEKY